MTTKREALELKLKALSQQEEALMNLVGTINNNLSEMGYEPPSQSTKEKSKRKPHNGIQIGGKLSVRGQQKAAEYFETLDKDGDKFLNFEDFRAMKAFSCKNGIVDSTEYENWESWRLYMDDNGVSTDSEGKIDLPTFLNFRKIVERAQPLAKELEYLDLGFLPNDLKYWVKCKDIINETINFRESKSKLLEGEKYKPNDSLSLEDISLVLNLTGHLYSPLEITKIMIHRCWKERSHKELIIRHSKKHLGDSTFNFVLDENDSITVKLAEEYKVLNKQDYENVDKNLIIPWLLSCPKFLQPKNFYRRLVRLKYQFYRFFKNFEEGARFMFNFAAHTNDRLLFRDFKKILKLPQSLQDTSTIKFRLSVGDENNRKVGMSGSWKLMKIDNVEQLFKKFRVPGDAGSVLVLDFSLAPAISQKQVNVCVDLVKQFLNHHFEEQLKLNKLCNGFSVTSAINDRDGSLVLRVALSYKRLVNLDGWLEHMLLPYRITDLITLFTGDFRISLNPLDLVSKTHIYLEEKLTASFDCTIGYRRNLIIQIFERLYLAMNCGLTKEQSDFMREEASKQEKSNNPKNPDEVNKKKEESYKTPEEREKEEKNFRFQRWRNLNPFFSQISRISEIIFRNLRGMQNTATFRLRYSSISEFLFKAKIQTSGGLTKGKLPVSTVEPEGSNNIWTGFLNYLNKFIPPIKVVFESINFKEWHQKFLTRFREEHFNLFSSLRYQLEERQRKETERRRAELIGAPTEEELMDAENRENMLEQMKRLGADVSETEGLFEKEVTDPREHIKNLIEDTRRFDLLGMLTLEQVRTSVLGLQSAEFITGKSRILFSVQGMELVELLPDQLPSMQEVVDLTKLVQH